MSNLFKLSEKFQIKYKTAGKISDSDILSFLKDSISRLKDQIKILEDKGINRSQIVKLIMSELVGSKKSEESSSNDPTSIFLKEFTDLNKTNTPGDLFPIKTVRQRSSLSKEDFDRVVLDLYKKDKLTLHHHDYPGNLTEEEKNQLVKDKYGNYYVGMALRSN